MNNISYVLFIAGTIVGTAGNCLADEARARFTKTTADVSATKNDNQSIAREFVKLDDTQKLTRAREWYAALPSSDVSRLNMKLAEYKAILERLQDLMVGLNEVERYYVVVDEKQRDQIIGGVK